MNRLQEIWNSPAAQRSRRVLARLLRVSAQLARLILGELRVVWLRISARARIFLIIIGLVLVSRATGSVSASLSATAQALAVLVLAFVGLWLILTSPFRGRRW